MHQLQTQWPALNDIYGETFGEEHNYDTTYTIVPFWVALGSAALLVQKYVKSAFKSRQDSLDDDVGASLDQGRSSGSLVSRNGGARVFSFMIARIWGCVILLGLSLPLIIDAVSTTRHSGNAPNVLFVYSTILVVHAYALILASIAIYCQPWRPTFIRHNILVLGSELAVYSYRNLWPLATYTRKPLDVSEGWLLWAKMGTLFLTVIVIPLCTPSIYTPSDPKRPEKEPHPEQTASLISLRTYSYFDPIIKAANRVPHFPASELPPLADYDRAEDVARYLHPYLNATIVRNGGHLFLALLRCFGSQYFKAFLGTVLYSISHLAEPIAVNRLLTILESSDRSQTGIRPWFWIVCLLIFPVVGSSGYQYCAVLMQRTLCNTESIITQLLFEYSLKMRVKADATEKDTQDSNLAVPAKRSSANFIGKLMNLVTIDLENLMAGREFFQFFWVTPFQIIGGSLFLYTLLGWSAFVGLAVMVLSLPLPGWLAKISKDVQEEKMKKADRRTQTVTESINVLRMIKMFGWESKIQSRIDEKREEEIKWVLKGRLLELFIQIIIFTIPTIAMMSTFATAALVLKIELTAAKVFSTIILFDTIRIQLMNMNSLASQMIRGKVSMDRIDNFFKETEFLDAFAMDRPVPECGDDFIGFRDACFTWSASPSGADTPSQFMLKIPGELRFVKNKINVIVGPTGSGKTSLLMALLGEMHFIATQPHSTFSLPRAGGVSFCVQESWVQNDTIRENILFKMPYEEDRYKQVLHQCALEQDLQLFEAGDQTEVGERGLTLSGGQKARLTLARAIYSKSDIVLLDDVLAALDVHTALWIVSKCLKGDLVKGRTVLLATHNLALAAPIAELIVSISADGVVTRRDLPGALSSDIALRASRQDEETMKAETEVIDPPGDLKIARKATGKLVMAEEVRQEGGVWKQMKFFLKALGGDHLFSFLSLWMGGSILEQLLHSFNVWFLGYWSSQYDNAPPEGVQVIRYMMGYVLLVLVRILAYIGKETCYMFGAQRASRTIHKTLSQSVIGSTMRWLDETPVSRILQRLTLDLHVIDGRIVQSLSSLQVGVLVMIIDLASAVMFVPLFTLPGLFIAMVAICLGRIYVKAQTSVKREMSIAKTPLLAHFGAAITGLVSVRAYGAGPVLEAELRKHIDHYVRLSRLYHDLNRWINIRIDILRGIFAASLAAYLTYGSNVSAANVGFSLNRAVEFCQVMLYTLRVYNAFLIETNSLERVVAYTEIEQEPKPTEDGKPPAAWPMSGDINVEKLTARYSESGPAVLHGITFNARAGERVGVVGRTGSGKSSLTLALLRCILTEGVVYFDGLDTSHINLDALRSNITVIPQTPELLSGTLRYNLDPFDEYDDATLNHALRACGLYSSQPGDVDNRLNLDSPITSGGSNVSVGQRQIIALARAMIRSSKLLILDEATSAIDHETDNAIQRTLRQELGRDVTVLTIAHRLQTIMDADRVLVLDAGRIAEFASPADLLDRPGGFFKSLVDNSADKEHLYKLAKKASQLH